MPDVSIIMPCHNGGKTIGDAVNSVINQTYGNWELIIVDDSSTDDSIDIVCDFIRKDSRIRIYHNPKCTKLPATPRNIGIEKSSGRYIAFLDCDDIWMPEKLEHQLPLFKNEQCGVVFSYYRKMNEDGNLHESIVKSPAEVNFRQLLKGNCIGNLTGMYDTAKVGKVYQKEIHHEDYLMWLEILRKGLIAMNTCTVEAYYRESSKSVSGSKLSAVSWTWNIYRKELNMPLAESCMNFADYAFHGVLKKFK
ncbi:MAG: glycosyltransferase family 2 protein [Spirochaetia bacterium]|nr:glycosyltransferase family 2 protein [Spirochaetia bacterium]